jgi:hypothetical protein
LLLECREDEVGLWYIIGYLRDDLGIEDPDEVRQTTLQLVRELLERGDIVAGWYAPRDMGFPAWKILSWPGSIEEILARIDREWKELGREPRIAEIVILQAKD